MVDQKTAHLMLPLPHPDNCLEEDLPRIRTALQTLDTWGKDTDTALAARLAQATAADEVLATLLLRVAATELAQAVTDGTLVEHGQSLLAQVERIAALERRSWFGTCESPGAQAAKALTLPGFALAPGVALDLVFSEVNAAENLTLAINDGEPKAVLFQGVAPEVGDLARGQIYTLKYSGSAWQIMAGMARDRIGQTVWFEDTLQRPGYVPLNGCTIENFSQFWPQMAAYLATAHGQERCFATLAEREAAHVAVWHTLASGETVNWNGFGGVCKFFYDAETDTLYLPDLRGMFRSMAGDGVVAPSMGGVAGDTTRPVEGTLGVYVNGGAGVYWSIPEFTGAFAPVSDGLGGNMRSENINQADQWRPRLQSSRVVPTGAVNLPRSWGALVCVYLGIPATA